MIPENRKRVLEIAAKNAKALSDIIESLIDTSVKGEGRLEKREFLPLDLVTSAVDQIVPLAEQKALSFRFPFPQKSSLRLSRFVNQPACNPEGGEALSTFRRDF